MSWPRPSIASAPGAAESAKLFGFTGYLLREVHLSSNEPRGGVPMMAARATVRSAAVADEPLPTEAGKATVSASVNGSVQLTR